MHASDSWFFISQGCGPDLVLLHGLGASSFSWRHNRAPLSRHFRVITPDLPGHGRSPAPPEADYRLEALVRGVLDFLDWQGLDTVPVEKIQDALEEALGPVIRVQGRRGAAVAGQVRGNYPEVA